MEQEQEQNPKGSTEETKETDAQTAPPVKQKSYIILLNGVKIKSKLNPEAKEFFPAHIMQKLTSTAQAENVDDVLSLKESKESEKIASISDKAKPAKQEYIDSRVDSTVLKTNTIEKESATITKEQPVVENKAESVSALTKTSEIEQMEGVISLEINNEKELKELKEKNESNAELNSKNNMQNECIENDDLGASTAMGSETPASDNCLSLNVKRENSVEFSIRESAGDVGAPIIIVDLAENAETDSSAERQKNEHETNCLIHINEVSRSQTNFKLCDGYHVPPTTPTEELCVGLEKVNCVNTRSDGKQTTDDDCKKNEKRIGEKKASKIAVCASSKLTNASFENKPKLKSGSVISRTKRISESLHNLTATFKSKADAKKTEGATKLPRSSTTLRKSTMRSRASSVKDSAECNGLFKDLTKLAVKETITARSNSSHEKSCTNKYSAQSSSCSIYCKTSNASTKAFDKSLYSSKIINKPKELAAAPTAAASKMPRETLSSTLRQSEAQKRRNLFPNDDPSSNTNIKLSQFLFK